MSKQIKRQLPIIVLKEFCVEFGFKGQENKSTTTDQFQKKTKNTLPTMRRNQQKIQNTKIHDYQNELKIKVRACQVKDKCHREVIRKSNKEILRRPEILKRENGKEEFIKYITY